MGRTPWPEVFAVALVAGATAIAIRGWPNWGGIESQTLAAWVQAFGSIAAIIGAYIGGLRQGKAAYRQSLKLTRRSEQKRQSAFRAVVELAFQQAQVIQSLKEQNAPQRTVATYWGLSGKHQVDAVTAALEALPLHELGRAGQISHVAAIRKHLQVMAQHLREALDTEDVDYFLHGMDLAVGRATFIQMHWEMFERGRPPMEFRVEEERDEVAAAIPDSSASPT